ncbi:MAG: UbiA family prenyltransferase [Bifidobacteriaceae bacterium]|nr:UbiA family prenyltransferase [Bifidobacteriaceae bacterium]
MSAGEAAAPKEDAVPTGGGRRALAAVRQALRLVAAFSRFQTLLLLYLHMVFFALCLGLEATPAGLAGLVVAAVSMSACYVNATAVNDLSDQAADKINLAGDPSRPLASDLASPRQVWAVATVAGLVCLTAAWAVSPWGALAAAAMLALNAAYSLPPLRLASRGALAQVLLPLEYVGFPAVLVLLAVDGWGGLGGLDGWRGLFGSVGAAGPGELVAVVFQGPDLVAYGLAVVSMYVIFVGRVFLKDIRDEVGDRATGKLTFTVRHGRRAAIVWSAVTTVAGTVALSFVMWLSYDAGPGFVFGFCGLSLAGQLAALVGADRAPTTAGAVLRTGIYSRWISMKVFFYVMVMLLVRSDLTAGEQALALGGVTVAVVSNVAMLYQQARIQEPSARRAK